LFANYRPLPLIARQFRDSISNTQPMRTKRASMSWSLGGCQHSRKAGGGRTQEFFAQMSLPSPWESRRRMLAPATTKLQTPLPPSVSQLALAKRLRGLKPRRAIHSTALALGQIPKKSNSFSFVKPQYSSRHRLETGCLPRELLTVR
jgi:hypothetical protein